MVDYTRFKDCSFIEPLWSMKPSSLFGLESSSRTGEERSLHHHCKAGFVWAAAAAAGMYHRSCWCSRVVTGSHSQVLRTRCLMLHDCIHRLWVLVLVFVFHSSSRLAVWNVEQTRTLARRLGRLVANSWPYLFLSNSPLYSCRQGQLAAPLLQGRHASWLEHFEAPMLT